MQTPEVGASTLLPVEPVFHVVIHFSSTAEDFVIAGIFSKQQDAEQMRGEIGDREAPCIDTMTMAQIVDDLSRTRLGKMAAVIEAAFPGMFLPKT